MSELPELPKGFSWERNHNAYRGVPELVLRAENTKWARRHGQFMESLALIRKEEILVWRKSDWEHLPPLPTELEAANYVLGLAVMGGIDFQFEESEDGTT